MLRAAQAVRRPFASGLVTPPPPPPPAPPASPRFPPPLPSGWAEIYSSSVLTCAGLEKPNEYSKSLTPGTNAEASCASRQGVFGAEYETWNDDRCVADSTKRVQPTTPSRQGRQGLRINLFATRMRDSSPRLDSIRFGGAPQTGGRCDASMNGTRVRLRVGRLSRHDVCPRVNRPEAPRSSRIKIG